MTDSTPGTGAGQPSGDRPRGRGEGAGGTPPTPAEPTPAPPTAGLSTPAQPVTPTSGDDAPAPADPGSEEKVAPSRKRTILIASVVAGVVVLGGVAAALAGVFGGSEPVATPSPSTITLPSPTPTIDPVARQPISPFADALPDSVLSYALAGVAEHPPLIAAGALEAYKLDYSDGGTGTVTLYAAQWETAEEAVAAYSTVLPSPAAVDGAAATPDATATAAPPESGTVEVGGQPVGSWTVVTAPDGTGTATWTNGTALFQAVGAADVVADFYAAFPL